MDLYYDEISTNFQRGNFMKAQRPKTNNLRMVFLLVLLGFFWAIPALAAMSSASYSIPTSVVASGGAGMGSEQAREVVGIGDADGVSNLADSQAGGDEESAGLFHSFAIDECNG